MTQALGTLVGRWYVTLLGLTFLWRASRHLGWRRTLAYTALAVGLGALAENGSVHLGIPYTRYAFSDALRDQELFIGDAPAMVAMSYAFMGYFSFAAGRLIASGPWRLRARSRWHEYALGVMLAVWAIWLLDPVARLGERWFLGDLFAYDGPGFWFGLPVGSQVGFTVMSALTVGILTWMTRDEADAPVTTWTRHPHLVALVAFHAQLLWLGTVAIVLDETEMGSAPLLMWVPAALVTTVLWSSLRPREPAT